MKVYGGLTSPGGVQLRTIIAAPSKAAAVRALAAAGTRITMGVFNGYWCETGNVEEIREATKVPLTPLFSVEWRNDFKPASGIPDLIREVKKRRDWS